MKVLFLMSYTLMSKRGATVSCSDTAVKKEVGSCSPSGIDFKKGPDGGTMALVFVFLESQSQFQDELARWPLVACSMFWALKKMHLHPCLSGRWKSVHSYRTTAFLSHTNVKVAQLDQSVIEHWGGGGLCACFSATVLPPGGQPG